VSIEVNMVKRLLLIFVSLAMFCEVGASQLRSDAPLRPEVKRIQAAGLENFYALSTNLYSGGSPEGDEAFAELKKLGIKSIITVDGAQPDVERAHAHGMRYVHLPHGYDGIPARTELQLIKAIETVEGPVYIHCHHGQHRGPVAAAVICMAEKSWSTEEAEAWLHTVGTGTNFQGLYAAVRNFRKPTADQIKETSAKFVESIKVSGLVDAMVGIDQTFDRLKTLRAAAASTAPDNHLLNEATLLREHFREAQRLEDSKKRGAEFMKGLAAAENQASAFEDSLTSSAEGARVDRAFSELSNACASCHRSYRDQPLSLTKSAPPLPR
jgi:protein tyrosine phosphatase (PTP) superfamily phosphohydrolase (DUF442 family)/cytochrome c556